MLIVALVGWPGSVQPAQAAGFTVNSTTDAVDANPGDGVCATAPLPNEGVRCTLRAAILEANALGGAQAITLPAGTFILTLPGANEDLGVTGDLDIWATVTIAGAGASQTIVDGNRLDRVFDVVLGGLGDRRHGTLDLRDVTVRNGRVTGPMSPDNAGGGIRSHQVGDSSLALTRVTMSNNEAEGGGGGVSGGSGIIRQSTISANRATGQFAGGGGLDGFMTVEDSLITGNVATTYGGATGSTIRRTTISGNTALRNGGGVGSSAIEDSLITANTAAIDGGGIYGTVTTVRNSTVSGNSAGRSGGGAYMAVVCDRSGHCFPGVFRNVTVVENQAPEASGVNARAAGTALTLFAGSILANNRGSPNCSPTGQLGSGGYNLSSDASCRLTGQGDLQGAAPLLGSLADNGGPTRTHALLPGSPAIDAGPIDGCPATDQRGQPRPVDGNLDGTPRCDIGAFEAPRPAAGCVPRPPVQVQATPDGSGRLQVTVSATTNPGLANAPRSITWDSMTNATVTLVGGGSVSPGQQTTVPAGMQSQVFLVGRQTAGQAATVHLTVTDACGPWPTLVGGGPSVF